MICTAHSNHVRTIYLDDPSSFNGISEVLVAAVTEALTAALQDDDVRAIVLSGKGKLFSSGGNLKNFMAQTTPMDEYVADAMANVYNPFGVFLRSLSKPLVCAINGPAIGAGVGIALSGDITVAARSAYFSLPFVPKLGVVPDMGSSWLLSRALNYNQALAMTLTGEPMSAEEAAVAGMIWRCVDDEQLADTAQQLAEKLAQCSPAAIRRSKQLLAAAADNSYAQQLELERELQTVSFGGNAFKEGLQSFAERRPADFISCGDD